MAFRIVNKANARIFQWAYRHFAGNGSSVGPSPITLGTLTLSFTTVSEDAEIGDTVGTVSGLTLGSTLTLQDDGDGAFELDGATVKVAATLTEGVVSIILRETLAGATNSPKDTQFDIEVNAASDLTLREQIEALDGTVGLPALSTLKIVGVNTLPVGVSRSGQTLTMTGEGADLELWDLDGFQVNMNGAGQRIAKSRLGESAGVSGRLYYILTGAGASDPLVEDNDLIGFDGVGGSGTFLNMGGTNTSLATNLVMRRNLLKYGTGDYLKVSGAGFQIYQNVFAETRCYPEGTEVWSSSVTYNTGDPVLNSLGYLFTSKIDGNLNNPVPSSITDNTQWLSHGPHSDYITVNGAIGNGDHLIYNNLFLCPEDALSLGLTQFIRYVRDTGSAKKGGLVRIVANVFDRWGGNYPFAAGGIREHTNTNYPLGGYCAVGGLRYRSLVANNQGNHPSTHPDKWEQVYDINMEGPVVWEHNWMGKGSGGQYFAAGMDTFSTRWGNNYDRVTNDLINAPTHAAITDTLQPAFGSAGPAPDIEVHGPWAGAHIKPLTYGDFRLASGNIKACAIVVHGQIAAYFPEGGTPVVMTGAGFVLTDRGSGVWELTTTGGSIPVKFVVSVGTAEVIAAVATTPEIFTSGMWGVTAGDMSLNLSIVSLPFNGGEDITKLQYRLNSGSWVDLAGTGTGTRTISGLTNGTSYAVQIRAVNAVGNADASDSKSSTPTSSGYSMAMVANNMLGKLTVTPTGSATCLTFSAWVKQKTNGSAVRIIRGSTALEIYTGTTRTLTVQIWNSSGTNIYNMTTATNVFPLDEIVHVFVSYDAVAGVAVVRLNGVDVAATPTTGPLTGNVRPARLHEFPFQTFDGEFGDVWLEYGSAVQPYTTFYNDGVPPDLTGVGSPVMWLGGTMRADADVGGNTSHGWNDGYNLGSGTLTVVATGFTDVT